MSKDQQIEVTREQIIEHARACRHGETRSLNEKIGGVAHINRVGLEMTNISGANLSGCFIIDNIGMATLTDVNLMGATIHAMNPSTAFMHRTIIIGAEDARWTLLKKSTRPDIQATGWLVKYAADLITAIEIMFIKTPSSLPQIWNFRVATEHCLDPANKITLDDKQKNQLTGQLEQIKTRYPFLSASIYDKLNRVANHAEFMKTTNIGQALANSLSLFSLDVVRVVAGYALTLEHCCTPEVIAQFAVTPHEQAALARIMPDKVKAAASPDSDKSSKEGKEHKEAKEHKSAAAPAPTPVAAAPSPTPHQDRLTVERERQRVERKEGREHSAAAEPAAVAAIIARTATPHQDRLAAERWNPCKMLFGACRRR